MRKIGGKKGGPGKLFLGLCTRWQLGDVGVSIPPWSALRGGSGQIDEKNNSWTWGDCNGGENDEKNNGKNEGI